MLKKYLFLFVLISGQFNVFSGQELSQEVSSSVVSGILTKDVLDGASIALAVIGVASFVQEKFLPTQDQKEKSEILTDKVSALKTESVFRKCLVENAFKLRAENNLPVNCQDSAVKFMIAHDIYDLNASRGEFVAATSEFDSNGQPVEKGWSWTKKILVGGVIVVTAVTGAIMLAPVLFPGTTASAQAQTIQSTVSTISTVAQTMAIDQAGQLALIAANNKLAAAAIGVSVAGAVRKAVCPTQAEELQALEAEKQARPSLREQIRKAYQVPAAK